MNCAMCACAYSYACMLTPKCKKNAPNKDKCNIHFSSAQVKKTEIVSKQFISYTEQQGFHILCGHRLLRLGLQHDVALTPRTGKPCQEPTSPTPGAVLAPAGQHSRSDAELLDILS